MVLRLGLLSFSWLEDVLLWMDTWGLSFHPVDLCVPSVFSVSLGRVHGGLSVWNS